MGLSLSKIEQLHVVDVKINEKANGLLWLLGMHGLVLIFLGTGGCAFSSAFYLWCQK